MSKDPVTLTVKLKADDEAVIRPDLIALLRRLNDDDNESPRIVLDELSFRVGTWNETVGHSLRERIEEALAERPISVDVEIELKSKRSGRRAAVVIASSAPPALTPLERAALDASRADDDARRIVGLLRDAGPQLLGHALRDQLSLSPAAFSAAMDVLVAANIVEETGEDAGEELYTLLHPDVWVAGHPLAQQLREEIAPSGAELTLRGHILRLLGQAPHNAGALVTRLNLDGVEATEAEVEAELERMYGDDLVDLHDGCWHRVEPAPAEEDAEAPEEEAAEAEEEPGTVIEAGDMFGEGVRVTAVRRARR